ncbi:cation diffusion facilitator family transporter [Desulfosporosinus shakirovi]|uniref:cation diffusion facilitator family transporter n=1 Tax=Desulfosporosinus shakirovi TaxID=2885154 RepID=UPI001E51DC12|nr:cation diffusion facilitator family transporter [Desulfosporosinus sp. SRJS8]MCB8818221.1 cation diffusion facilitator family transporter [Desulfosporosinus sp. SRJS8]
MSTKLTNRTRIAISMALVALTLTAKLFFAFKTNSLALFSDSWHLFTDLASLIICLWGLTIATKPADLQHTFGHYRHSVLAALINNITLILVSLVILYMAFNRYLHPLPVEPQGMIAVSVVGLIVNFVIVQILKGNEQNLNLQSAFLHFIGDALADFGVLVGGLVILWTGWMGIDTLLSAILACLILRNAFVMTRECLTIFLESAPTTISIGSIREAILSLESVRSITDIHIWSLSKEIIAMTAHVEVAETSLTQEELLHKIQQLLTDQFGIVHTTIQLEHTHCGSCFHRTHGSGQCTMCIDSTQKYTLKAL